MWHRVVSPMYHSSLLDTYSFLLFFNIGSIIFTFRALGAWWCAVVGIWCWLNFCTTLTYVSMTSLFKQVCLCICKPRLLLQTRPHRVDVISSDTVEKISESTITLFGLIIWDVSSSAWRLIALSLCSSMVCLWCWAKLWCLQYHG